MALEICSQYERKHVITGHKDGCTTDTYGNYILEWYNNPLH